MSRAAAGALQLHSQTQTKLQPPFHRPRGLAKRHGFPIFQEQAEEQHGASKVDKRVDAETGVRRKAKSKGQIHLHLSAPRQNP